MVSCLDSKRLLLNTGGLPGGGAQRVTWSRAAAPELRAAAQRRSCEKNCLDSKRPLLNTGACPEEEEEEFGHLDLE